MENKLYNYYTENVINNIKLMRYLHKFRSEPEVHQYNAIRANLIFGLLNASSCMKNSRKKRHEIRKAIKNGTTVSIAKQPKKSSDITEYQFNTCSYNELTYCIRSRLLNLAEYKQLLSNNTITEKYPLMEKYVLHLKDLEEKEVRRLLKMRRALKKSVYSNWSDRLPNIQMEETQNFNLYNEYLKCNQ